MPTKSELIAWLQTHPEILGADSADEQLHQPAIESVFGLTKMPELIGDSKAIDEAIRHAYAREAPDQHPHGSVRLEIDIDATGLPTRIEVADPPPLPPGVDALVAVAIDATGKVISADDGSDMNASSRLNVATVNTMRSLARFTPGERDGQPVDVRRFVMTFQFA